MSDGLISTEEGVRAVLEQSMDEVFCYLADISYVSTITGVRSDLYLTNNYEDITSAGTLYEARQFKFTLPSESPTRPPVARLVIEDADRSLVTYLRDVEAPPDLSVKIVRADDPSSVEGSLTGLLMRNLSGGDGTGQLTFDIIWDSFVSEPYPLHRYDPSLFPGLFR